MTPAVTGPSGTVTYSGLEARVAAAARGLARGVRFAVCEPDPLDTIVAVLAADRAGATAVVVDAAWSPAQRRRALSTSGVTGAAPSPSTSATPFWVGFTSGSAGTPRPIARTSTSWTSSYPMVSQRTGIRAGWTVGIPGPLASSLFLFGTLHALWAGAHVVTPGRWDPAPMNGLDAAHCVPTMLADLLDLPSPPPLAVCGGAALPSPLRERARSRGVRIADYYGATELSFVAWGTPDGRLEPLPDVDVEVRGGELWVRSPYLSLGYAAPPDNAVEGPLRWDDAGFATVGDLGTLHGGTLQVHGRGDGTIMCGGTPVLPQDVEHVLLNLPTIRDAVVVGTPHARLGAVVTAVIEPTPGHAVTPALLTSLRTATRHRLAAPQRPRHWYVMPRLPRTGAGKVARTAVAEAVRTGTLDARRLR